MQSDDRQRIGTQRLARLGHSAGEYLRQRHWVARYPVDGAEHHRIRLSCLHTGHSRYVKGTTRISNHTLWRAVDIDRVDGQAVSAASPAARALVGWLDGLQGPLRPTEIGSPFPLGHRPYFSDDGHQHHIHVGYGLER